MQDYDSWLERRKQKRKGKGLYEFNPDVSWLKLQNAQGGQEENTQYEEYAETADWNRKRKRGRRGEKKMGGDIHGIDPNSSLEKWQNVQVGQEEYAEDKGYAEIVTRNHNELPGGNDEHYIPLEEGEPNSSDVPFYGLLDDQEQEYFKQADTLLGLNQFADSSERDLFLDSVYKEAHGKELKIANSQSCSRLMERLIACSSALQLKSLWGKFNSHFLHLFQHRFASHCCEALFRKAAPLVQQEMSGPLKDYPEIEQGAEEEQPIESLFLNCVQELNGNLGYLGTDRFASHPLRVLLAILSGIPLSAVGTPSLLQSKKKENNYSADTTEPPEDVKRSHAVPLSFQTACDEMIHEITGTLDTTGLRSLSTHPIANPVLQLLLQISLMVPQGKQRANKDANSLLRKMLPDENLDDGSESSSFIKNLSYDPVGSRLIEVLVTHSPGKVFKAMYRSLLKERLASMARNDIASFVVIKIIERLSKEDLGEAISHLCEDMDTLVKRSKYLVLRTIIERCRVRGLDETPIASALQGTYGTDDSSRIDKMLNLQSGIGNGSDAPKGYTQDAKSKSDRHISHESSNHQTHASLLAQTMLSVAGPVRALITSCLLTLQLEKLQDYAQNRSTSQIIQTALLQPPEQPPAFRKQFVLRFCQNSDQMNKSSIISNNTVTGMAIHPVASHVLDAIWEATVKTTADSNAPLASREEPSRSGNSNLNFLRERIADELVAGEAQIKDTVPGKAIWRNWKLDLYKRRGKRDWLSATIATQADSSIALASKLDGKDTRDGKSAKKQKTGIELARERFAKERERQQKREREMQKRKGRKEASKENNNSPAVIENTA